MGKIKLLNTAENGYFNNNQLGISDSIPTDGEFNVGDIIIKAIQVANEAIGWICVEAGNPGIWSEFGGMLTEGIKPDSESVGMNELNNELKVKMMLIDALNNNIKGIKEDLDSYATKEDLENIDLSLYATKEDLENIDITETVGELPNLVTDDKSNLVAAINELKGNFDDLNAMINGQVAEAINNINDLIDLL